MSDRREFSTAVRAEIIKRTTSDGVVYCEQCGVHPYPPHTASLRGSDGGRRRIRSVQRLTTRNSIQAADRRAGEGS